MSAEAFQTLVEPHLARLAIVLRVRGRSVLGSDCDEHDLVQTVLLAAWRLFPTFVDRGPAATWGWLAALGEGVVLDRAKYQRAKGRDGVRHLESFPLPGERPSGEPHEVPVAVGTSMTRLLIRREARARVEAALEALEPGQRDVVVRHMLEGTSLAELAREQGVSRNAVWERLHRGMARLRTALAAA